MIGTRCLTGMLAVLALAGAGALAQPAEEPTAAPPADSQPAPAPDQDNTARDNTAAPTRSPSDYRASEEISEDLPVSFPVDI